MTEQLYVLVKQDNPASSLSDWIMRGTAHECIAEMQPGQLIIPFKRIFVDGPTGELVPLETNDPAFWESHDIRVFVSDLPPFAITYQV